MRSALPITSVSLVMISILTAGCSQHSLSESALPSLRQHQPHIIVQVPGDYQPDQPRENPYYVVCNHDDCSAPTPKTPARSMPSDPVIVPHNAQPTQATRNTAATIAHTQSARVSSSYRQRTSSVLEKYRVHFDYASHQISERFRSLLKGFVSTFSGDGRKAADIRVTGYTDSVTVPAATVGNEWLALERATSVKRELVSLGYPENRILLEAKFLCCYLDTNETESGRYNNRRAEISLIQTTE